MIGDKLQGDPIRNLIGRSIKNINTMFVGIIEEVDVENMKYNVKPIMNRYDSIEKTFTESATLFRCPIMAQKSKMFYMRVPYAVGDVVYVGVCKDPLDESLVDNKPRSNKMLGVRNFREIDGVILGGLMCESEEKLSGENIGDLIIQNRKNKDKIVLKNSGGAEIKTSSLIKIDAPNTHITGKLKVDGATTIGSTVDISGNTTVNANMNVSGAGQLGSVTTKNGVSLDNHTHKYNPGPNPPTSTGKAE